MLNGNARLVPKLLCGAVAACLPLTGAWACPVPADADSAYHTMSRLLEIAPRLGVRTTSDNARRDPSDAHPCEGGQADGFPCSNVDLLSHLPLASIGGGEGNDIWGWTDPVTGSEYALIGKTTGTAFVDITEPEHPQYLGSLPSHTGSSTWRDVKTYDSHAFIVSEASGHGMQVFDLTELRNVATPRTFSASAHYPAFGAAHNIAINEDTGFAYVVGTRNSQDGCGGGLHMVDVSRPAAPGFAGCFSGDGYTHDTQCVVYSGPDTDYTGREVCFNYNEDTLTIVDVTDKATPVQIARMPYSGASYTHQGWLTEDQAYLLLDDESDELSFGHNTRTFIWNVADLDAPQNSGSYLAPVPAIDHNLYIKGDFAYQANYRAGLRILDLSNIASGVLVENGFFDVYPASDSADFDGSWSVYPYFDSGVVIVSGIGEGLFVLRPTALEPGFMLSASEQRLAVCGDGVDSAFLSIEPVGSYTGSVMLEASGAPAGVTIGFTPVAVTPPGNAIVAATANSAAPGVYPLTVTGDDGELQFDQALSLELSDQLPAQPQLLLPAAGADEVSGIQTLYWDAVPGAFAYDVEVATDAEFANVVLSAAGIGQRTLTPPAALLPQTQFFWRVTAHNACGSVVSAPGSFFTAASECAVYASTDVPVAIPSGATGTVTSTLTTTAPGSIVDVNVVGLQATHSWINDIDIRLEGPLNGAHGGTSRHPERPTVLIMAQSCNNEDDLHLNFDDEAAPGPLPCPPTGGGTYQPANPLAAFDGSAGAGDWNLLVTDNFIADGGSLDAWGLEICTAPDSQILDADADGIDDTLDNCAGVANPTQRDTDGDGFGNYCDPDLNNDGRVNFLDLESMQAVFFATDDPDSDLNGDGITNFDDLNILKAYFFGAPGPSGLQQ